MLRPQGIGKEAASKKQTKPIKPPKPTKLPSKPSGKPASRTTPALLSSNQKPSLKPKPSLSSSDTSSVPASKISLAAMTANRPSSLNLSGSSIVSTNKFRQANRALNTNILSLPHSPVCDDLHSPTNSGAVTDSEDTGKIGHRTMGNKNRSCSFYVDFNSVSLPSEIFRRKPVNRSTESILETPEPDGKDTEDKLSDAGSFSSDSLESTSEFGKPPRRCVSDYQIFNVGDSAEPERFRSASAAGQHNQDRQVGEVFLSQESILSDGSQLSSSADILQIDRHSSASFFLRNREACRSSESILTDESDYQFLFQGIGSRQLRDSCSNAQSTESILTDDSEMQTPAGCSGSQRMPTYEDSGFETASQGFVAGMYQNENTHRGVFRTRSLHDTRSSRFGFSRDRAGSPMVPDGALLDSLEPVELSENLQMCTGAFSQPTSPPLYRSASLKAKPQSFFIPLDSGSGTDGESGNRRQGFPLGERKPPFSRPPTGPKPEIKVKPVIAHKPPKPRHKMGTIPGPGRSHLKSTVSASGKQDEKSKQGTCGKGLPREMMSGSATWTKSKTPAKHIRGIEVKAVAPKDTVRTSTNSGQFFEKAERATVSPDSSNSDDVGTSLACKSKKNSEKSQTTNEAISSVAKEISDCYGNSKGLSECVDNKGPSSDDTGSNTLQQTVSHVKLLSKKFESSTPLKQVWPRHISRSPSVPCQGDTDTTISMSFSRSEDGLSDCNDDSLAVVNWDSGSSTPATSSSCANSPKRLWPRPVGLSIPGQTSTPAASNQLAKRLALRQHNHHQLLPSKCVSGTTLTPLHYHLPLLHGCLIFFS